MSTLALAPGTAWTDVLARAIAATPEAFEGDRPRNLIDGEWRSVGTGAPVRTPVDGTVLTQLLRVDGDSARQAVQASALRHGEWAATPISERKRMVSDAIDLIAQDRDLLAQLLGWEIGK